VEEPKAEEPEMIEREPTEPHNDVPDLVALATTGFSADLVASTLGESSVSTEDMPPIDPTVAYEDAPLADDAPAAHGESLPDAGLDLVDADAAPKRPEIGSFWRGNVVFYEVTAVTELMVGLAMYEDRGRWTDILYSLENFDGKFNSVAEPPDWVLNLKTARFAAQRGTTIENPAAGGDNGNAATAPFRGDGFAIGDRHHRSRALLGCVVDRAWLTNSGRWHVLGGAQRRRAPSCVRRAWSQYLRRFRAL
jgi:hypothetical protein